MRLLTLPPTLFLSLLSLTFTTAHPAIITTTTDNARPVPDRPLPLLIWHGLGDKYDAEGLRVVGTLAAKVHPGTHVYYIRVDEDGNADRTASFFGNVTAQIEQVCEDIKTDPRLLSYTSSSSSGDDKDGVLRVDALGFSQGGQFLRGLVERCEGLSVRSLVTWGSQHNGIQQFQTCGGYDFVCKGATALIKGNAWTDYVQSRVVPAQYYRPWNETAGAPEEGYFEHSGFLADVNNEREVKSKVYKERIAALEKFVMYVFEEDATVIPKESGWFSEVNATSGDITPLRERRLYKEDWLGLKKLDEKGGLVFKDAPGKHMEISQSALAESFRDYFGPETNAVRKLVEQWPISKALVRQQTSEMRTLEQWWRHLFNPDMKEYL